jgi:hypothetical protein
VLAARADASPSDSLADTGGPSAQGPFGMAGDAILHEPPGLVWSLGCTLHLGCKPVRPAVGGPVCAVY